MNRENRKKSFEKGYYKTHSCNESFNCRRCGALSSNRIAADDNSVKLMQIAMKPMGAPPFPVERMWEMAEAAGLNTTVDE